MNNKIVKFAIVGHPNKGKTSVISSLAQDGSAQISSYSYSSTETTSFQTETYHCGFELIDTPCLQKPQQVLTWLQQKTNSAEERSKAVANFVADTECHTNYPNAVEILHLLVNGAAIIYVVDGSKPYTSECEAEMEILLWSGRPSIALINTEKNIAYIDSWKKALEQYFKMVRIFNPKDIKFEQKVELFQSIAYMNSDWSEHLALVIKDLTEKHEQRNISSLTLITRVKNNIIYYKNKFINLNRIREKWKSLF